MYADLRKDENGLTVANIFDYMTAAFRSGGLTEDFFHQLMMRIYEDMEYYTRKHQQEGGECQECINAMRYIKYRLEDFAIIITDTIDTSIVRDEMTFALYKDIIQALRVAEAFIAENA